MDIKNLFEALVRRWWVVVLTAIIGAGAAIGVTTLTTPEYSATTRLFVSSNGGVSSTEAYQGDQFSQQRASSYAQIISSKILGQRVAQKLGLARSGDDISKEVLAVVIPKTVLIDVTVTDSSASTAARLADTLASEFTAYITPLETPVGQTQPRSKVTVVSKAEVPTSASSPKLVNNLIYGIVGGLLVGMLLVIASHLLARRVRRKADVEAMGDLPVLGPVTSVARSAQQRAEQLSSWASPDAEGFRKLRVFLQAGDLPARTIVVASSTESERTADASIDLAIAFAETGEPTVLIETNAGDRSISAMLETSPTSGLSQHLSDQNKNSHRRHETTSIDEMISTTASRALSVITLGSSDPVTGLLSSTAMARLMTDLRERFFYVVIDTGPVTTTSAAAVLAEDSDAVVLMADTAAARRRDLKNAIAELQLAGHKPAAVVLVSH